MNLTRKLSWPCALAASIALSASILLFKWSTAPCLFVWWYPFKTILYVLLALVLFTFLAGSALTRISIAFLVIVPALAFPAIDVNVPAAVEAQGVRAIRNERDRLEAYRTTHPAEGYPQALPDFPELKLLRGHYSVHYSASRTTPRGPADQYTLQLITCHSFCGPTRSFTVTEDRLLRYTRDGQAATRRDPPLE